jgi:ubiquitin-conjugating enzyme E2 J2
MTRLTRELKQFRACPPPYAPLVHVDENKILDWHILIQGVPDSAYEDGWYVMKITFKPQYPFQAPAVSVLTPNGRFQTSTSICMSMTEWHQETWNPAWSVATIVTGFLSFMVTDESTTGGMRASEETRRTFARESVAWNASQKRIVEMFPEIAKPGALEELKYKGETKVTGVVEASGADVNDDAIEASGADANDDANAGVEDAVLKKARVGASPGAKK